MGVQLSVNLSVVSRSAFSYETPATIILRHFLVSFLPPLVTEDRGGATYPIFVSMGQETEGRCAPSSAESPRSWFLWNEGNPSRAQTP